VTCAGAIIKGLPEDNFEAAAAEQKASLERLGISPIALVPTRKNLHLPTMAEIAKETNAEILYGHGNLHAQFVENIEVGTLQVPDLLAQLQEQPGTLVVAAAGRTDIVLSLLLATQSK